MLRESNAIEGVHDDKSYVDAKAAWDFIIKFDKLNIQIIQETHKILMKNQPIEYREKGAWRTVPVYIAGKKKDQPPLVIDSEIRSLLTRVNEGMEDAVKLHVEFENIHPFIDGNGRMGRIIMNWQLVKHQGRLIIYYEELKNEYYRIFDER